MWYFVLFQFWTCVVYSAQKLTWADWDLSLLLMPISCKYNTNEVWLWTAELQCFVALTLPLVFWLCWFDNGHYEIHLVCKFSVLSATNVVVLDKSPCPWGSSRTSLQVLVLVLEPQVLVLGPWSTWKLSRTPHSANSQLCMITWSP